MAVATQNGQPNDVAFGRYIHETGLAIPLVLLLFGSIWMFPLITALVAGDIVAAEDHNGTLKTILTRSVERGAGLRGQGARHRDLRDRRHRADRRRGRGGRVAGLRTAPAADAVGHDDLDRARARSHRRQPARLPHPDPGHRHIGLLFSTVFRNSAAAVVGTLMASLLLQLIGILPGLEALQPYLLSTQFNAWQGLLRQPVDWAPIVRAAWVCSLYAVPAFVAALLVFLRRDVAGG